MGSILVDIQDLYQAQFGSRPHVGKLTADAANDQAGYAVGKPVPDAGDEGGTYGGIRIANPTNYTDKGFTLLSKDAQGVEIWLPVWLYNLPESIAGKTGRLYMPYTVIRITGSITRVKTALSERIGTVKELYSIDDYIITIKGFLIDKERRLWPEKDLEILKQLHELGEAFNIDNALTNIFLAYNSLTGVEQQRVVMTSFDLPEVQGGRRHVRPFVMQLESDNVFTLEEEDTDSDV